jgi:hypothetical protein
MYNNCNCFYACPAKSQCLRLPLCYWREDFSCVIGCLCIFHCCEELVLVFLALTTCCVYFCGPCPELFLPNTSPLKPGEAPEPAGFATATCSINVNSLCEVLAGGMSPSRLRTNSRFICDQPITLPSLRPLPCSPAAGGPCAWPRSTPGARPGPPPGAWCTPRSCHPRPRP